MDDSKPREPYFAREFPITVTSGTSSPPLVVHREPCAGCDRYHRLLEQEQHRVAKLTAERDELARRVKELEEQR